MNPTPPNPSRALRIFAAAVKWSLWLLLAASLLLSLAWGALHGWIVPRIGEWRPVLESRATQVLGVPVRIGAISARSEGLVPSFELQDVVLSDPTGREALRLPLVVGALSPRSLWNLSFEQLYIQGPELEVRRTADGRILVAGLDFDSDAKDDGAAADWFFRQAEFAIQGGTLRWTDELRGAPPLALRDVSLVVRNQSRRHALRVDATPPADWGGRFTVSGLFRGPLLTTHPGRWRDWNGEVHADFAAVDLSQLRRHADFGFEVSRGQGRVRAWADVTRGQVVGGLADVQLADVVARLAPGLEPLSLQSVSGRLGGARLANGFRFETQQLHFVTDEGHSWPGGNVAVTWTGAEGDAPERGELQADRLDLGALSLVATRLPLGTATHAALQAYAPQGRVDRLQARWQGPPGALQKYEARGRASGLQVAARPAAAGHAGTPGMRGVSLDFDFTHEGGKAKLALADGELAFPGVFEEPVLPMASLSADVQWQRRGEQLQVGVEGLRFANADAEGGGRFTWRSSAGGPGTLDLDAGISRADGARVWRYLPLGVNHEARAYVRDAVLAGRAADAKFRVRGDLRHFPFVDNKDGEFLVTAQVRDVTLAYVPHTRPGEPGRWPALTHLAGELVFQGNGMEVRGATGRFATAPRLQVKVHTRIPHFDHTEVHVKGQVAGPLAESLAIVNASPLAATLNQALARSTGSGNAAVDLALLLPIADLARSQVRGTVTLAGNDVQITPDSPLLARARGSVQFTEQGFQLAGVQARALGGDVRLEGGTRPASGAEPAWVQLRAQGTVTAEALRQARELGFAARLARDFSGSTGYQLTLGFRRNHPELLVTSNLQGLALNLPAPLNKPADALLPLRYETALTREALAPHAPLQETLSVGLGRIAAVHYLRDVSQDQPKVLRGAIAIGASSAEPPALPAEGVQANVQLDAFNIDAWEETLSRVAGPEGAVAAPARDAEADGAGALDYMPTALSLRARQLGVEGRTLHDLVLAGAREGRTWRARVDARELSGDVEYRQPQDDGAGRLRARLARLTIGAAAATEVEALLEQQPGSIPALDVVVEDFELKGRKLGKLEIDAVNRGAGPVSRDSAIREWRLNRLNLSSPDMNFSASGNWAAVDAQAQPAGGSRAAVPANERRRTAIRFRMDIRDAGLVLARFGMKDVVRRGRGSMEGTVAWAGSPLALDYPTLTGNFNVSVESGQFLKAEPGLAKLLGVLSLQSLPRRLTLDFRDVFSEGFQFDFVRGDIVIEQGIAATNNLQMKGVNAAVLMEGKADIARETQDLKVVVVPEINAGTASLVATVINPAIGLGTFLAQYFLRDPLMRAATQEFQIDGTWADPRVRRVPRTPAGAPQAAGPPAQPVAR